MPRLGVLVVEDDPSLREFVRRNLEVRGFQVAAVEDGLSALAALEQHLPDLIVLDVMLPGLDGLKVCQRVRQVSTVPIIVLSALGEQADKVRALDLGADDYLTKPFGVDELLARVRAVLRRSRWTEAPPSSETLRAGSLEIDTGRRRVTHRGAEVKLTPTEFDLLALLVSNAGKVLTHRFILQRVWGPEYGDESEYLRVYVGRLRRKLEADPAHPRIILTEQGVGYRFEA